MNRIGNSSPVPLGSIIDDYKIVQLVGSGSFGSIYRGQHIKTAEIRIFKFALEKTNASQQLLAEFHNYQEIYKGLKGLKQSNLLQAPMHVGTIPDVYKLGEYQGHAYMTMELLGSNLSELVKKTFQQHFSFKTVLMIADQLLTCLQKMHSSCYLHCDLKPENIMIGIGNNPKELYLVDMGLAYPYWDETKSGPNQHIPLREFKELNGTPRYLSMNVHLGLQQSRRDDIESWFYVIMYFLNGGLPWSEPKQLTKSLQFEEIYKQKAQLLKDNCSFFNNIDNEWKLIFHSICTLRFDQSPDYNQIRMYLVEIARKNNIKHSPWDWQFDWCQEIKTESSNSSETNEIKSNMKEISTPVNLISVPIDRRNPSATIARLKKSMLERQKLLGTKENDEEPG